MSTSTSSRGLADAPATLLFAGGGSGGHIFPALAIAHEAQGLRPGTRCRWLVSQRPLDAQVLSKAVLPEAAPPPFDAIPAQPVGLRPRALWRFVAHWGEAVRASRRAIQSERAQGRTVVLVAMGGFVAAPAVQAARAERTPILLVNLDAVPGKANRWIARHARQVLTAARVEPAAARATGWQLIAPIVRPEARSALSAEECKRRLGIDPARRVLLITGGSQGAGSINAFASAFALAHAPSLAGWHVLHQTGKDGAEAPRAAYSRAGVHASVVEFTDQMGLWWGCADAALARSGAGNVAEVWSSRVPTLFLPYPYHRDQHQRANAQPLVASGAALLADDRIEPALNLAHAGPVLLGLLGSPPATSTPTSTPTTTPSNPPASAAPPTPQAAQARREAMRKALEALGLADGATRAARVALGLAGMPA